MDIEKEPRRKLVSLLRQYFICFEECELSHPLFRETGIRADVVACGELLGERIALAFEVKAPSKRWELKHWLAAFKQASDYVDANISDVRIDDLFRQSRVLCSFVFPAPSFRPWTDKDCWETRCFREHDLDTIRGAQLLAQHFKVGVAELEAQGKLRLRLGTDTIWSSQEGFRSKAEKAIFERRVGSRRLNLLKSI